MECGVRSMKDRIKLERDREREEEGGDTKIIALPYSFAFDLDCRLWVHVRKK
jgi:hypothetical protein